MRLIKIEVMLWPFCLYRGFWLTRNEGAGVCTLTDEHATKPPVQYPLILDWGDPGRCYGPRENLDHDFRHHFNIGCLSIIRDWTGWAQG